jgi:hypothetical protein
MRMSGAAEVRPGDGGHVLRFPAKAPCPVVVETDAGRRVTGTLEALVWPFPAGAPRPDHALAEIFAGFSLSDEPVPAGGDLEFAAELPCPVEVRAGERTSTGRLRAYRWPGDDA